VDRDFRQAEFQCRAVSGVTHHYYVVAIDHNRLSEAELLQTHGDRVDRLVIQPGIFVVRSDRGNLPKLDFQTRVRGGGNRFGHEKPRKKRGGKKVKTTVALGNMSARRAIETEDKTRPEDRGKGE